MTSHNYYLLPSLDPEVSGLVSVVHKLYPETQVLGGPYTRVLDGFISIFVEGSGILLSPWWTGSRG